MCLRIPVSELNFYPGIFHQSPDSVGSPLLPAIPQFQREIAITIDAHDSRPELFNLSCQISDLPDGVVNAAAESRSKSHRDEHPASDTSGEQSSNRYCYG